MEKQLKDISASDADFADISQKANECKTKLNEVMQNGMLDTKAVNEFNAKRDELKEMLNGKEKALEKQKFDKTERYEQQKRIVNNIKAAFDSGDNVLKDIMRIRHDQKHIAEVQEKIKGLEAQLDKLKKYEEGIYKIMLPKIQEMAATINAMKNGLEGKSHVELDISRWNIQGALRDAKTYFRQMTKEFEVQDNLVRTFEKIEEAMSILIDVYDRIESFSDTAKLAAYIADINSGTAKQIRITDVALSDAITYLEQFIQSNLVLEQYEVAMHAFKQHRFPFAHQYLAKFELPDNLKLNDTGTLIGNVMKQIDGLIEEDESFRHTIGKYDRYIYNDIQFDDLNSDSEPFYVWKNGEIKNEIVKLLQGEEITIKSDITKGVDKNAIKFKEIGIHLKAFDESTQNELNAALQNARLVMTILGNNYYRCGTRVYYISVDDNIVINYTLAKDSKGKPIDQNLVYEKINKYDYFLSPYAMWKIKLVFTNDRPKFNARNFQDKWIDLQLIGRGQYLEQGPFTMEICNDDLDKFYNFDNSTSQTDFVEPTEF